MTAINIASQFVPRWRARRRDGFLAGALIKSAAGACGMLFSLFFAVGGAQAQQAAAPQPDYSVNPPTFPNLLRPYRSKNIPKPDLNNTAAVADLVQEGVLRLSVAQLMSLVMQNNLGIEMARYNRFFSQTDSLRARSGSAPRGSSGVLIPSELFTGALGSGIGTTVAGVVAASGPSINASARSVSLAPRGAFDPSITFNFSLDHSNTPLSTLRVSGVPNSITSTGVFEARYAQMFTTGTSFSVSFNSLRQSTNQTVRYNPAYVPATSLAVIQPLLNGFGFAVNRSFSNAAKNGRQVAREVYRQQVITTLVQAQNSYWNLVALRETVRAAEQALQVSQKLFEDNKRQEQVGTLAPLDVISAESEVASNQRDLIIAQTNLQQAEVQLKTLISKQLNDPLANARIETADPLPDPQDSDIPKLEDALATAMQNRPELPQATGNLLNQEIAVNSSKNNLLPSLNLFGLLSSNGLYGNLVVPGASGVAATVIPGGWGSAASQVFNYNYPDYAFGISLTIPIRNRSAQADNTRAQLERQQLQSSLQRTQDQITLEVRNAIIGLAQAKAQIESAKKAVEFERQTVDAEQKKLNAGTSTPYNVILVQRDLFSAELSEVQARATYANAGVELDRSTGIMLEKQHINAADVPRGVFASSTN